MFCFVYTATYSMFLYGFYGQDGGDRQTNMGGLPAWAGAPVGGAPRGPETPRDAVYRMTETEYLLSSESTLTGGVCPSLEEIY